jgi:hypothetical protein
METHRRHASVFISRNADKAVIVPMHFHEGVYVEDESVTSTETPLDPRLLGTLIREALMRSQCRSGNAWRGGSPRQWPAFRASGVRTVKSFERDYIRVSVVGANEANIIWEIEGYPAKDAELRVRATVSAGQRFLVTLGERVLGVYHACRDWPFHEVSPRLHRRPS